MSDKSNESNHLACQSPNSQVQTPALVIDASNLACPLPLLKAKQGLNQLQVGQILKLIATDPGSVRDFHTFAELSSHQLLDFSESDCVFTYYLKKGGS